MTPPLTKPQYDRRISPNDHMLTAGEEAYFRTTDSGLDCILRGLASSGRTANDVSAVLDFGCGYGRIYRAIVAQFPEAKTYCCDLMTQASHYCATTFGGEAFEAHEELTAIRAPRLFDLVWFGSILTHLPSRRWVSTFDFLRRVTVDGATIVFTSHGDRSVEQIEQNLLQRNPHAIDAKLFTDIKTSLAATGFQFAPNKPAAIEHQNSRGIAVSSGEYGFSFTSRWWVEQFVERTSGFEIVGYIEAGWGNNHDAITVRRKETEIQL